MTAVALRSVAQVASTSAACRRIPVPFVRKGFTASRRAFRRMSSGREVVFTEAAPAAVGPYSQAIKTNGFLYISGQVPLVPGTKEFNSEDISEQAEQVMSNLGAILKEAGSSFDKVVKTTILLTDMGDFAAVNAVYGKYFPNNPPARACFAVKSLPLGAKVEIEAVALA